jgi:CheY-like chemotaxis protein
MNTLDADALEQQVRDCLLHLYDYIFLQEHPLVHTCVPDAKGDASRIQVFRQIITDAIESLNPGGRVEANSRETRLFDILQMRYINQQQIQFILHRLNLSERQFYRDHAKAVQTLSRVLSEQIKGPLVADAPATMSIQSEVERVHNQGEPQQVNALNFVQQTLVTIQALVQRHQAQIDLHIPDTVLALNTDRTVLRQAIIWIMSQLITQSPEQSSFSLSLDLSANHYQFIFRRKDSTFDLMPLYFAAEQKETLHTLVSALGGQITEAVLLDDEVQIVLEVPLKQRSILIIDDNPDVIALFRRYLAGYPYQALTAPEGDQAIQIAREAQPGLIILDVMLPKQDGWEILQLLKNHRTTRHIPVLICSVLNAADLAQSVGADGFLRKPPRESEFLEVLSHFLTTNPQST